MGNMEAVKAAVRAGRTVYWRNKGYLVTYCARLKHCVVTYKHNGSCVGLYWTDGITTSYKPEDFFTA